MHGSYNAAEMATNSYAKRVAPANTGLLEALGRRWAGGGDTTVLRRVSVAVLTHV